MTRSPVGLVVSQHAQSIICPLISRRILVRSIVVLRLRIPAFVRCDALRDPTRRGQTFFYYNWRNVLSRKNQLTGCDASARERGHFTVRRQIFRGDGISDPRPTSSIFMANKNILLKRTEVPARAR